MRTVLSFSSCFSWDLLEHTFAERWGCHLRQFVSVFSRIPSCVIPGFPVQKKHTLYALLRTHSINNHLTEDEAEVLTRCLACLRSQGHPPTKQRQECCSSGASKSRVGWNFQSSLTLGVSSSPFLFQSSFFLRRLINVLICFLSSIYVFMCFCGKVHIYRGQSSHVLGLSSKCNRVSQVWASPRGLDWLSGESQGPSSLPPQSQNSKHTPPHCVVLKWSLRVKFRFSSLQGKRFVD